LAARGRLFLFAPLARRLTGQSESNKIRDFFELGMSKLRWEYCIEFEAMLASELEISWCGAKFARGFEKVNE